MSKWTKPNNKRVKEFTRLYLDPSKTMGEMTQRLGISRATYYRYAAQSGIPTLKVSLLTDLEGTHTSQYHWRRFRLGLIKTGHQQHMRLAMAISKELGIRFETQFSQVSSAYQQLDNGQADISFASMTYSPGRFQNICFSYSYLKDRAPQGAFFYRPSSHHFIHHRKPRLGLLKRSMLDFYSSQNNFDQQFKIIKYTSVPRMINALKSSKIDMVFDNPHYHDFHKDKISQVGETIYFNGHTGIAFSQRATQYKDQFNKSLERLDQSGFLYQLTASDA